MEGEKEAGLLREGEKNARKRQRRSNGKVTNAREETAAHPLRMMCPQ